MSKRTSMLSVFLCGVYCGKLSENAHGALSFSYDKNYHGIPLSLSMPTGLAPFDDHIVRPYLMGLLPDEEATRTSIGRVLGISGDNPFRLLSFLGRDCPGAVQIIGQETARSESSSKQLIKLSEKDIEVKLAAAKTDAASAWTDELPLSEGHWSLGGCQSKLALRKHGDAWYECTGDAATTHILKPGVNGLASQALCEYLSMRTAHRIGLPVAPVSYQQFGTEPAIIVERYDRIRHIDGTVTRIHQEDLCQALSVMPSRKYAEQGGPTTPQIISLLNSTGGQARENVHRFILYLFFNYLIGATDAHAKNHSILFLNEHDVRIAPLYDVASIAPYRSLAPKQRKPLRAALSIGGENRFGTVAAKHVERLVEQCDLAALGLTADMLIRQFASMASLIPQALQQEIDLARQQEMQGIDSIAASFESEVGGNCRRTLNLLGM